MARARSREGRKATDSDLALLLYEHNTGKHHMSYFSPQRTTLQLPKPSKSIAHVLCQATKQSTKGHEKSRRHEGLR